MSAHAGRKPAKAKSASDAAAFLSDARELLEALGIRALSAIAAKLPDHELAARVLAMRAEFGAQAALRLLERGEV